MSPTGAEPPRREGYSEGLVLAVLRELEKTYLRDGKIRPEGSVPGARARFTRLVLGCIIEPEFCIDTAENESS